MGWWAAWLVMGAVAWADPPTAVKECFAPFAGMAGELYEARTIGTFRSKKGKEFEIRLTRLKSDYRISVWSTGPEGEPMGTLIFTEQPQQRTIFLQDAKIDAEMQGHGLATAVFEQLAREVPAGTRLRMQSTNAETNARVKALLEASEAKKPIETTEATARAAEQTERVTSEVRRLLREGPREEAPLWARSLDSAGWKQVKVEVTPQGAFFLEGYQ